VLRGREHADDSKELRTENGGIVEKLSRVIRKARRKSIGKTEKRKMTVIACIKLT